MGGARRLGERAWLGMGCAQSLQHARDSHPCNSTPPDSPVACCQPTTASLWSAGSTCAAHSASVTPARPRPRGADAEADSDAAAVVAGTIASRLSLLQAAASVRAELERALGEAQEQVRQLQQQLEQAVEARHRCAIWACVVCVVAVVARGTGRGASSYMPRTCVPRPGSTPSTSPVPTTLVCAWRTSAHGRLCCGACACAAPCLLRRRRRPLRRSCGRGWRRHWPRGASCRSAGAMVCTAWRRVREADVQPLDLRCHLLLQLPYCREGGGGERGQHCIVQFGIAPCTAPAASPPWHGAKGRGMACCRSVSSASCRSWRGAAHAKWLCCIHRRACWLPAGRLLADCSLAGGLADS